MEGKRGVSTLMNLSWASLSHALPLSHEQIHLRNHTIICKMYSCGQGEQTWLCSSTQEWCPRLAWLTSSASDFSVGWQQCVSKSCGAFPGLSGVPSSAPQPEKRAPMDSKASHCSNRDKGPWASPLSLHYRAYAQSVNKLIHQGNCFLCHLIFYSLSFQRPEKLGIEQTGKNN